MKILSCCPMGYYGQTTGDSYEYQSFVEVLRYMGHRVHHFDHVLNVRARHEAMNDFFLSIIEKGGYDLILVMTSRDEFLPDVLDQAKKVTITVAWNCDDDWRWESYSSKWIKHYTYMVTTYRHIYESNRKSYANLLLNQWGCTGFSDGGSVKKNINISFVGGVYGERHKQIERLQKELDLQVFGRNVRGPGNWKLKVKRRIAKALSIPMREQGYELLNQSAVKDIWNRSRILFTPLEASKGDGMQIKARIFDQGLSKGLMLCSRNEAIHEFYDPGKEYVEYENMDDCIKKAHYYLKNERERGKIADAYYWRTKKEHLWNHRYEKLFKDVGL